MVVFNLLDYFRDLVIDIAPLSNLRTDLFGGIHHGGVVSITKMHADLWQRQVG